LVVHGLGRAFLCLSVYTANQSLYSLEGDPAVRAAGTRQSSGKRSA